MATVTLTPARAARRARRVDRRVLAGIVLAIVASGCSFLFWGASTETRSVLVAVHDLPSGATLAAGDVTVARVHLTDPLYQAAIPATEQTSLVGTQLSEPIHAHQVLVHAQFPARPALGPGQLGLTIPMSPETAVGGHLHAGDAVQVLLTLNKGKPESRTTVVLPRVTVLDVGYVQRSTVVNTSGTGNSTDQAVDQGPVASLTLIVTQEQAVQLAQARWSGDLDVALLPPTPTGSGH